MKNVKSDIYTRRYHTITIRTTEGSTLTGKVNLTLKDRVSELFTRTGDPFIVLIDVQNQEGVRKVLFINKQHIVWVEPHDDVFFR